MLRKLIEHSMNWFLKVIISKYTLYSPHFVLSSLATVPAAQAVHEEAPSVLIEFISHLVQEDLSEFLYVPAGHLTEEC